MHRNRRGVTLIELVVVLAILAIMATVATPALRSAARTPTRTTTQSRIAMLRDSALALGHAVTAIVIDSVHDSVHVGTVTAYPDGSVLSQVGDIDRLTGRPRAKVPHGSR